jgi:CRISPR-associated protein Cas1
MQCFKRAGGVIPWLFLLGCIVSAAGQTSAVSAPIRFTVVDEDGAAVSGAQLILQEPGHGEVRLSTDYAGHGELLLQGTEPYRLRIEKPGFYETVLNQADPLVRDVRVVLNHEQMVLQQVSVTASVPGIDPEQASNKLTMNLPEIINVPYPTSRDIRNLLPFYPGLVKDATGQVHVAGSETWATLDMLDGFDIRSPVSGVLAMRVQTAKLVCRPEESAGRFLARVTGSVSGNVLLRRQQYRMADGADGALSVVQTIVAAKIANCRVILLRAAREISDEARQEGLRAAANQLSWAGLEAARAPSIDQVRGHEGFAGQTYFSVFDHMIAGDREAFHFDGRSRRPPLDRVNALLSFVYALLRHDIESALESVGLDPAVGFLHTDRPGRPSLALDLMEELRSALADRLVLTLINRRQVQGSGFTEQDGGGILMDDATRKVVVSSWQLRKQDEIEHSYLKERIPIGLVPYAQALLLARYVRGGLDAYPAYFWR